MVDNTPHRPEIPYVHSGIFLATLNTDCRWSKRYANKNVLFIAKTSTPTGKSLLLVQRVQPLHLFIKSSIPHNLAFTSKVITLAMNSTFIFAYRLLHLQSVFRVAKKNVTVDIWYLWSLGCILYHLSFWFPTL